MKKDKVRVMTQQQRELAEQHYQTALNVAMAHHRRTGADLDLCISEAMHVLCQTAMWFSDSLGAPFAPVVVRNIRTHMCGRRFRMKLRREILFGQMGSKDCEQSYDPGIDNSESSARKKEVAEVVAKLRKHCNPIDWSIIYLRYHDGLSLQDVGDILGISGMAVYYRCREIVDSLRRKKSVRRLRGDYQ